MEEPRPPLPPRRARRALEVRLWLDELKALPLIALEAKKLDPEGLEALRANLKAFPKALFDHYEADFALFRNNLFYHQIPARRSSAATTRSCAAI